MEELKSCPFCGGEAKYHKNFYDGWNEYNRPKIVCTSCYCVSPIQEDIGKAETIKAWNRREG